MKRIIVFAGLLTCVASFVAIAVVRAAPVHAQQQPLPEAHLSFEVVSVKQNPSAGGASLLGCHRGDASDAIPKGRCVASFINLRFVILYAYGYKTMFPPGDYISGAPNWLLDDKYDIQAKAENDSATEDELREMLRSMLADSFKLKLHETTTDLPGYSLVVGRGGSRLKEAEPDEKNVGMITTQPPGLNGEHMSMKDFAQLLTQILNRPVVDNTEQTGFYDFTVVWGTEESVATERAANLNQLPEAVIKEALQSQMGLLLQSQKGQKKQLVIDHIEKPPLNCQQEHRYLAVICRSI